MHCTRCDCQDPKYFVVIRGLTICRRCISYNGNEGNVLSVGNEIEIDLPFELTPSQQIASHRIADTVQKRDVLVKAVCGAGKTELVMETIRRFLTEGKTIGVAIARRQVVLQLSERFRQAFPGVQVSEVCEGHTKQLSGQLIVCTTHQLFRFPNAFDCLILDEPDAFPFKGNDVLHGFSRIACRGTFIYLSATPDRELLMKVKKNECELVEINQRPHGAALPVPRLIQIPKLFHRLILMTWMRRTRTPQLIFVPTIDQAERLAKFFRLKSVTSHSEDIEETLRQFTTGNLKRLICTTVLERGLTFAHVQVAVMSADHIVFDASSLTQISGRVGRSMDDPSGEVLFLFDAKTKGIRRCINDIKKANASA